MDPRSHYIEFFDKEIHKHYEYLRKFLLTATKDHPLALDITQETMATAWEKIHRLYQYSDIKHALRAIAKNKLYDYYRKNKSYSELLPQSEIHKDTSAEEDGLLHLLRDEERRTILAAIGDLSWEQMQVILLRYYYGQSFRDVAKMTKTNYNTVLSHHRRALKALGERLGKELEK